MFFTLTLHQMRKCLAVIFLIIFSFQVLPLKVLGKLLSKAQTEEEVKNDCDDDADADVKVGKYNDFISNGSISFTSESFVSKNTGFVDHKSDDLPKSIIAEIPSPPPNS